VSSIHSLELELGNMETVEQKDISEISEEGDEISELFKEDVDVPEKCHEPDPNGKPPRVRHSIGSMSSDEKQEGVSRWFYTGIVIIRSWLTNYLLEWRLSDARDKARMREASSRIAAITNESDVACFLKPGGLCPFCNLATTSLSDAQKQRSFTLHLADLMADDREVLSIMLEKLKGSRVDVTFPAIFVGGEWLPGGYQELKKEICSEAFFVRLDGVASKHQIMMPLEAQDVPTLPTKPQLWHQAGGGPPLAFQTKVHTNVIRSIALLQVCLLLPVHAMLDSKSENTHYTTPLLSILLCDALLNILVGPTPFSPLGILSTLLVWHRRGSVRSILPYKLTFLLYVGGPLGLIACPRDGDNGFACKVLGSKGIVMTMIMNSIYLSITCF